MSNRFTGVIVLTDGQYIGVWNGHTSRATFNSRGAAQAWVSICNRLGKLRV